MHKTALASVTALASTAYAVGAAVGEVPAAMIPEPHTLADFAVLTLVGYMVKERHDAKSAPCKENSPVLEELQAHRIDFAEFSGNATAKLESLSDRILRVENYCDSQRRTP